jgi:creatinine amidohydrolase
MPAEFAKLTSKQILELSKNQTVFFFAVGPMEDHGSHLPVGIDLMQATQLCFSAAQRLEREMPEWRGVLMPQAPLGVESNTQKIALTVRAHVLRDWLVDSCRSLGKIGFRHFVCFSGHLGPKQLTAIEDAARLVSRSGRLVPRAKRISLVSASSALVKAKDLKHSFFFPNPGEHGGAQDTSSALFMKQISEPASVSEIPKQEPAGSLLSRGLERVTGQVEGYWGDPAQASAEQGQQFFTEQLDHVFPKLRAVWEGSNPNALFRSWYSILFFNKSFFKAWLIGIATLCVFIAWYWMSLSPVHN